MGQIRDRRKPGWFWIDNDVLDKHGADIGAFGIAVYAALCRLADNTTQETRPTVRLLAKKIGISERKVQSTLRELADRKLIAIIEHKTEFGDNAPNDYHLLSCPDVQDGVQDMHAGGAHDAPGGVQDMHPFIDSSEQDLSELSNSIVHAPTNGDARTQEKDWPEEFQPVKKVLTDLEILPPFNDPAYWKAIETWTDTCGFPIYYLDELRAYHAYQIALPPGGKNKHRDMKRGFRTWIANAINFRRRDAERKANWQRR